MLLDLMGPGAQSDIGPVVGLKLLWYETAGDAAAAWPRSMTELLWYKHIMLAGRLGCTYLHTGYTDPLMPRLLYKLERFWDHTEALTAAGWRPLNDCVERDADGVLRWNPLLPNLTKRMGGTSGTGTTDTGSSATLSSGSGTKSGAFAEAAAAEVSTPAAAAAAPEEERAAKNGSPAPEEPPSAPRKTKEVSFDMRVDCDGALSSGSAVKQQDSTGSLMSRRFMKKGASWLLLEKEIEGLVEEADGETSPSRQPAAAPEWFFVEKASGLSDRVALDPAAAESVIAPCSGIDKTGWFALERQVLLCAIGLSYKTLDMSVRSEAVDSVPCWAGIKNLF